MGKDLNKWRKKNRKNLPNNTKNIDKKGLDSIEYPLFCFQYLQDSSIKKCKDGEFLYNFLMRLKKLSEMGWKEIHVSPRHKYGVEKIPVSQIKPKLPLSITPDVTELTVFRACTDNRPFLGFRTENVFHVVFIEAAFNDIYDHGSK